MGGRESGNSSLLTAEYRNSDGPQAGPQIPRLCRISVDGCELHPDGSFKGALEWGDREWAGENF